jgi:RNA 3'-terminal phosphate cyclase (ATP)
MLVIDGSQGEGGGQVLRTALTLAVLTGRAVRIESIRAGRPKPGLMAQHLKAVEAAAAVSGARVTGASPRSTVLQFIPRSLRPGDYRFDIGTAGSTSLVLQTIALPLGLASAPSRVVVTGGTHVPWSPCFHYLATQWQGALAEMGFRVDLELESAGFYPHGGGVMRAAIHPVARLTPLVRLDRGDLKRFTGFSAAANLDPAIASRQQAQALKRLAHWAVPADVAIRSLPARSPGTLLFLSAECTRASCAAYALGARGKPAEKVADEAVDGLEVFLASGAAVDPFLADQLMLPLVFAAGVSSFRTSRITRHLLTIIDVIRSFVKADIVLEGRIDEPGTVRVAGAAALPEAAEESASGKGLCLRDHES